MLTYNIGRIFEARGINKPYSYLTKAGYSSNTASRFINKHFRKLNLDDVERLCELLRCTPNDLLEWTPRPGDTTDENHPLNELKRDKSYASIRQMLKTVPLNKLSEIENMIKKEIGK